MIQFRKNFKHWVTLSKESLFSILRTVHFILVGPSGAPTAFITSSDTPFTLILSWNPPRASERNGIITHYEYFCTGVHNEYQSTTLLTVTMSKLKAFTNYKCSVKAATAIGTGPAAISTSTTAQDSQ